MPDNQWNYGEQCREERGKENGESSLVDRIVFGIPAEIEDYGSNETAPEQAPPRLEHRQHQNRNVEQGYVTEQNDFVILSRRQERRCGKAANQRETSQYFSFLTPRQRYRCSCHDNHGHKRSRRRNQMIDLIRSPQ